MPTTVNVTQPPKTIAGTVPIKRAVNPDSNWPISFDEPMNIEFTAETLPLISSGVSICNRVDRMITLTLSKEPSKNRKKSVR